MFVDIAEQVTTGVTFSKFGIAIEVDESIDVTNWCQLLVYARFTQDNAVNTEQLMSELLSSQKQEEGFNVFDKFFA